jgi:SPP1 gp7 family putative phage head morphogenesis protein
MTRNPREVRRVDRQPTTATRRRRGPQVPHNVMAFLIQEWERHHDALTSGLGWRGALRTAWRQLQRQARRGVASALGAVGLGGFVGQVAPPPVRDRDDWELDITAGAAATGVRAIANGVMEAFVGMVEWFARGVGAHDYIWTSQNDDRVRTLHRLLNGTRQSWDDPPVCGTHGFRGAPGEPAGCRCTPFPVL